MVLFENMKNHHHDQQGARVRKSISLYPKMDKIHCSRTTLFRFIILNLESIVAVKAITFTGSFVSHAASATMFIFKARNFRAANMVSSILECRTNAQFEDSFRLFHQILDTRNQDINLKFHFKQRPHDYQPSQKHLNEAFNINHKNKLKFGFNESAMSIVFNNSCLQLSPTNLEFYHHH